MLRHTHLINATVTDAQNILGGIGVVRVTVKRSVARAWYLMRSYLARWSGRLRAMESALWMQSHLAWALAAKPVAHCAAGHSPARFGRPAGFGPEESAPRS